MDEDGRWMALCHVSYDAACGHMPVSNAAAGRHVGLMVCYCIAVSKQLARKIGQGTDRATQLVLNAGRALAFWLGVFVAVKLVLDAS